MENLNIWNQLKQPPNEALKKITGGRLRGKTDINPQWRYKAMTEIFGPCGIGWKYEIKRLWLEPAINDQIFAFAEIILFVKIDDAWSEPIPGIGGSMAISKEKDGPYASDECFKMAVTDALSVALKMLGVAADVYAGLFDGSKYRDTPAKKEEGGKKEEKKKTEREQLFDILTEKGLSKNEIVELADFIKSIYNEDTLSINTMKEVIEKPDAFINEWKEMKNSN